MLIIPFYVRMPFKWHEEDGPDESYITVDWYYLLGMVLWLGVGAAFWGTLLWCVWRWL